MATSCMKAELRTCRQLNLFEQCRITSTCTSVCCKKHTNLHSYGHAGLRGVLGGVLASSRRLETPISALSAHTAISDVV